MHPRENATPSPQRDVCLFGVRSPMVVEYEDVCARAGLTITAAISLGGAPRLLRRNLVIDINQLDGRFAGAGFVPVAFGPERRRELHDEALKRGLVLAPAVIDPSAVLSPSARVGDGSFVNAGVVVGALSFIGACCLINRSASLGHHTVIGDFVSIGPGAVLASNIKVGEGSLIGAGATILPNVEIGAGAVIAAGSVVRKTVGDGVLMSGNPAQELRSFGAARRRRQHDKDE